MEVVPLIDRSKPNRNPRAYVALRHSMSTKQTRA